MFISYMLMPKIRFENWIWWSVAERKQYKTKNGSTQLYM